MTTYDNYITLCVGKLFPLTVPDSMRKLPNEFGHLPSGELTVVGWIGGSYSHAENKTQNGSENVFDMYFQWVLNWYVMNL